MSFMLILSDRLVIIRVTIKSPLGTQWMEWFIMKYTVLAEKAKQAMAAAYAPYSGFMVGAALLCADGSIYTGCNIENGAYSPTLCAERTAFAKAVSEGKREFTAIAVCGGKGGQITGRCTPCGVCRQVMAEFCREDFEIILVKPEGYEMRTLSQLLPECFSL